MAHNALCAEPGTRRTTDESSNRNNISKIFFSLPLFTISKVVCGIFPKKKT
jgi:hypothetical protein